jgi:hypothetical protein
MRLQDAWIGNNGEPIVTSKTNRRTGRVTKVTTWQVRWRFEPLPGRRPKECKDSSFPTKARAKAFIEELWKAHHRQDNWRFDAKGRPTDTVACEHTVLGALEEYVSSRWHTAWKSKTRTRVLGRLVELVAVRTLPSAWDSGSALLLSRPHPRPEFELSPLDGPWRSLRSPCYSLAFVVAILYSLVAEGTSCSKRERRAT